MPFLRSPALDETGYVVLDPVPVLPDPAEWEALEYVPWRSSGITRFAPLASYDGTIDCNGFWNRTPPRTDKGGVWVPEQVAKAPGLVALATEPGADIGRCRVIELQPNTYADAVYNLHRDDNNRLNTEGTGWVVRGYVNLTDDADSYMLLREDPADACTEVRLRLAAGARLIIDTQRFWHAVWHPGSAPRYALLASLTSGPELDAHIAAGHGDPRDPAVAFDPAMVADAQAEAERRHEERRQAFAAHGIVMEEPADED